MAPLSLTAVKRKRKMTLEVPAGCASANGGALSMSPTYKQSPIFAFGGCDWTIRYCPVSLHGAHSFDLCLHLETWGATATILYGVDLVDPTGTLPPVDLETSESPVTMAFDCERWITYSMPYRFMDKRKARYVKRGSLTFQWTITILSAETPDSRLGRHKVPAETDVTFSVGGELFDAHMFVLALRSPVFKAELFGGTLEMCYDDEAPPVVVVEDMRPDVFQALLCYIYNDYLPPPATDEDENDMLCCLLVAADRYDVQGLKLLCEANLSRKVDVDNVAKMLSFADDHYCSSLKDACVQLMADSDM